MEVRSRRLALAKQKTVSATDSKLFKLLLAYYAFEYVRFQDSFLPFLAPLHIPMFITIGIFIAVFRNWEQSYKDTVLKLALVFLAEMALWVPFARNNFWAFETVKSTVMIMSTVLLTFIVIKDTASLLKLFKAFVVFCLLEAVWILTHGGHGPGGFVQDQNDVCLVMDVVSPFAWYLAFRPGIKTREKLFFLGAFAVFFAAMVVTDSRGGMLGYVAAMLVVLLWSRNPGRNLIFALLISVTLGGLALQFLPAGYVSDMETITNKNDDTRKLRLLHWTTAWAMFEANPLFGVGPYNYPWNSQLYFKDSPYYNPHSRNRAGRQAHSVYFTVIPEEGLLGIALFLSMLYISAKRLIKVKSFGKRKRAPPDSETDELVRMAKMLAGGFAGFLIAGAFISVLYYPIFWHLLGWTAVLWALAKDKIAAGPTRRQVVAKADGETGDHAGPKRNLAKRQETRGALARRR